MIVRNMDDNAAVVLMVDSNLQREHILPSERAFAYKMKLESLKNQGARSDLTSSQVGTKLQVCDRLVRKLEKVAIKCSVLSASPTSFQSFWSW